MLAKYIVIHVNIEILKSSLKNIKRDYESFFLSCADAGAMKL